MNVPSLTAALCRLPRLYQRGDEPGPHLVILPSRVFRPEHKVLRTLRAALPEVKVLGVLKPIVAWLAQVCPVLVAIVDIKELGPEQGTKPGGEPHLHQEQQLSYCPSWACPV